MTGPRQSDPTVDPAVGSGRLVVEWSTDDPRIAAVLHTIAQYPDGSPERMELEAALHTAEAGRLHREAGRLRGHREAERIIAGRNRRAAAARHTPPPQGDAP